MSVLLSKVDRGVLFSSRRIIDVENGGGETYAERGCLGLPKIEYAQNPLLLRKNQSVGGTGNSWIVVSLVLYSIKVFCSSFVVIPVGRRIWRITSFKTAQKLQTVDEKISKKGHSWNQRKPKIINCVLLRRTQKISGMLIRLRKILKKDWNKETANSYIRSKLQDHWQREEPTVKDTQKLLIRSIHVGTHS